MAGVLARKKKILGAPVIDGSVEDAPLIVVVVGIELPFEVVSCIRSGEERVDFCPGAGFADVKGGEVIPSK